MTRTVRLILAVLFAALALLGVFATTAYASLEDTPTPTLGTSATNPGSGADYWWRQDWGNSLYPEITLAPPGTWDEKADGYLLGTIYRIDHTSAETSSSYIATTTPWLYDRDSFPTAVSGSGGTNFDNTLDIEGIYLNPPGGSWPPPEAGAHSALEGHWFYHYAFYSNLRYQNNTWTIPFGVDLTPPRAVTGLNVTTGVGGSTVTTWTPATRARLTWDFGDLPGQYDDLSGIGYYQVLIDGQPAEPETSATPKQGRVYGSSGFVIPPSFTIESMPPGAHQISVVPVDRATNVGPATSAWFYSDPDTPTISWADPAGGVIDPRTSIISVNASDLAGDPRVKLSLDGSNLATLSAPPYKITPDMSAVASGTHTISASVTDHLNRTVTITKQVVWNPNGIAGTTTDPSVDVTGTPGSSPDSADNTGTGSFGWTNNLAPIATLVAPDTATDVFYNIAQTPAALDTSNLQNYFHSLVPEGTLLQKTVDLRDSIDSPPLGGWNSGPSGYVPPYEGSWYFQWVWYNNRTLGVSASTYRLKFNVDRTPPAVVTGFSATPGAGVWTSSSRVNLKWDARQYDALSGDRIYQLYMDDQPVASTNASSPMAGSATIEDMPAGRHKLSIAAVDMAGNVGPMSSLYFLSDPLIGTVKITEPTSTLTPHGHTFSAEADDPTGGLTVTFGLSGGVLGSSMTPFATFHAPPYAVAPDLSSLPLGAYTFYAVATDPLGRSVTATEAVFWDPTVSLVPNPAVSLPPDTLLGTSGSNPSDPSNIDTWWRQGWGNSLTPDFELAPPAPDVLTFGHLVGTLYSLSTVASDIDIHAPDAYYRAARGSGTNLNQTVDLQGVFNYPPAGGWRPTPVPGATSAIEGRWYLNFVWFTSLGYTSADTYHGQFGIDITPPSAVESLAVSPTTDPADATQTIATSRVNISWKPKQYDALSGVAYFQVLVDGSTVIPDSPTNPDQGRVYCLPGVAPSSVTIENLSPGKHTIGICAVDRANNAGPVVSQTVYSDPDVPKVKITTPSQSLIGVKSTVQATASDQGGVKSVVFKLDGVQIGLATAAPYSAAVDLSGFSAASHTLSAVVTDRFGRTATDTKQVTLDKTALTLSGFTRSASLFFPIKRDGYKDNLSVSFTPNKACTAQLIVRSRSGSVVRTISKGVSAGRASIVWNGKWSSDGNAHTGTFSLQVVAIDAAGNTASTGRLTTSIKNFQIVRVSGNKVKIVPR